MRPENRRTHQRVRAIGIALGVPLILCLAVTPGATRASTSSPPTMFALSTTADGGPDHKVGAAVAMSMAAHGDSASPPLFRVTVDNGVASVVTGDTLTYSITVQNLGTAVAGDLLVTQSIPVALEYVLADPGGTATAGRVTWDLALMPNETATFRTIMAVLSTPSRLDGVSTSVCVATAVDAPPQVCATDTDQRLEAGADAAGAGTAEPAANAAFWWSIGAACAAGSVLVVGVLALLRRRRAAG